MRFAISTIVAMGVGMTNIQELFGKRLRHIRKQKAMTQEELSDKSKLSIQYIGEIERGKRNPSLSSVKDIALALDVTVPDMFNVEEFQLSTGEIREKLIEQISKADDEKLHTIYTILNNIYK